MHVVGETLRRRLDVSLVTDMTALPPEADIKLNLGKRSACDPKQTLGDVPSLTGLGSERAAEYSA